MKRKIVVALGGNALGKNLNEQLSAVKFTAKALADLIEDGNEVVITHGNGPQVGRIDSAMAALCREDSSVERTPLSMCVAMSQAYIGYDIQNALREELLSRNIHKPVATIVTQVLVDGDDPALQNPTKPIGKFMSEDEAQKEHERLGFTMREDAGRGWRRVVPSPEPKKIVELDAIRASVEDGSVVICCGGGGIPVKKVGNFHKGVGAVIDKDNVSSLLADNLNADILLILTAIDKVRIRYGKPDELSLDSMSLTDARRYIADGEFAAGSMLPKVEAAARFVENGNGRIAVIAALHQAGEAVRGQAGTVIFSE
ncbi:MAG: carbamate kinase [Ruminococcus sp.]|nr:carbamate kinase [Ruminococcus sp.]